MKRECGTSPRLPKDARSSNPPLGAAERRSGRAAERQSGRAAERRSVEDDASAARKHANRIVIAGVFQVSAGCQNEARVAQRFIEEDHHTGD